MSLREVLANNFKALKASKEGLSKLPEITAAGGGSNGTLGRIQKGKTGVSIDTLDPLAAAYGVEPWQLIAPDLGSGVRQDGVKQSTYIKILIEMYEALPEANKEKAFAQMSVVLYNATQPGYLQSE